jgi:hypothetical protein
MTADANFIPGDKSQEILRAAALEGTMIKNIRLYIKDGCDFSAPDQVSANGGGLVSGTSGLNVGSFTDPTVGSPSDVWTNSISFAPAGPFTLFVAHSTDGAGIQFESETTTGTNATATITTGGEEWDDWGFEVGDTVLIDYNTPAAAPRYAKVQAINAAVMSFEIGIGDASDIEDANGSVDTAIHGASPAVVAGQSSAC